MYDEYSKQVQQSPPRRGEAAVLVNWGSETGGLNMADLVRRWFEDDGGIAHAVDPAEPDVTLCGKPGPSLSGQAGDTWAIAPGPRCQRCVAAAA